MAHIIIITSGLRGLLNASFELAARLSRAGHRVTCACPHDVRELVEAQGLDYVQLPAVNFDPAPEPDNTDGSLRARLDEWRSAGARREAGIDAMNLQPFRDFIESAAPDLVLTDAELYEHVFTLHQMEIPVALITPFFSSCQAAGVPPLPLDIVPGQGWRGSRPGLLVTWWQRRAQRFKQIKLIGLRNAFTERRSVLKALARRVGYPLRRLEEYGPLTMFNDTHLPLLHLTASELEFAYTTPGNAHYVGPMVSVARIDQEVSDADRERLKALYTARQAGGGVLIYCWLTTMDKQDTDFLLRVTQAVADHADWTLIVGHGGGNAKLQPADNVHVFDFVPQLEVLAHADICVTHGGMNTVHECLLQRTRMLLYPRFNDQPGVSARMVHHGLAHRGDVVADSADAIAGRIWALLTDQTVMQRLDQMHKLLQRYEENKVAEKVVASLLR